MDGHILRLVLVHDAKCLPGGSQGIATFMPRVALKSNAITTSSRASGNRSQRRKHVRAGGYCIFPDMLLMYIRYHLVNYSLRDKR